MKTFYGNQVIEVDGRELAQLSAGGDTKQRHSVPQHHSAPQPPSIAPSTRNIGSLRKQCWVSEIFWQASVAIFCAILNGSVPSPQPLPLSPTVSRPAHLPSSPCPLCSSLPSCSTFSASFMSFHLTLSRSLKSSSLHRGEAARSVSRRVLRGPSKPQRQQHNGLFQEGLGARGRDEKGTSQHPSALTGC